MAVDRAPHPRGRGRAILAAVGCVAALVAVPAQASAAPSPSGSSVPRALAPAHAALVRLVGSKAADQVDLRLMDPADGADRYAVEAVGGRVTVGATTPATALAGFGAYLRTVVHADFSLNGDQLRLPRSMPLPAKPIHTDAVVAHRFAFNDTNEGYANPYLSWRDWQHRIDVLALDGINEVLVYEGQEAVYQRTFEKFGYSATEMRSWIPQPGHQPWWLLQNTCCLGSPITQQVIDDRISLTRRITDRLRSLDMTPVLPGYFGTVPPAFAARNAGAHTVPQGTWGGGQERPDWLDPTGPVFADVAARFYQVQQQLFGASTMFKMDLLHEGGSPGDVNVADAARATEAALQAAHPGAIWAILGWQANPRPDVLQALNKATTFVVDGNSDQPGVTDRDQDYKGVPYAFGTIWNFGGHTGMGAYVTTWNTKFHEWLARPGNHLDGIALMPEAIDNNPVAVRFFSDLAWEPKAVDLDDWFAQYATSRYGGSDAHAVAAWRILAHTSYAWPSDNDTKHTIGLYEKQPSLAATSGTLPYDPAELRRALGELLAVRPALRTSTAYRYDLVDLARQVLSDDSRTLLPQIQDAYADHDRAQFERLSDEWMKRMGLLDNLVAGDSHFLLGAWQADAAKLARSSAEDAALQREIRMLLSRWSNPGLIQDYAAREWNGLISGYYAPRWQRYFDALDRALRTGKPVKDIDWIAVADRWVDGKVRYRSTPTDDAYPLAERVLAIPSGTVSLSASPAGVRPGRTTRVTAVFTNDNPVVATRQTAFTLRTPDGYRARPVRPRPGATVPAGAMIATRWEVTVPRSAEVASTPGLTASVTWTSAAQRGSARGRADLLVAGPVHTPYRTASTTDVEVAQNGTVFAIAGGGADAWGARDEFGTIYRPDLLTADHAVTTRVLEQSDSAPYARAGLAVRSDLATPHSPGYATIAVTPEHGCMFSWDSDGNGTLDRYTEDDGFTAPTYVRISRTGDHTVGSCSGDGRNWAIVGTAQLPGAGDADDVGFLFSAVNANTDRTGLARFRDLAVTPYMPRDDSADQVVSVGRPTTALSSEEGRPPSSAVDGSRANSPYWGGVLGAEGTWWQVDLGDVRDVSSVNVRNYVDGTRVYRYLLMGSADGAAWFPLGGKLSSAAATDAGDTYRAEAEARYVRVVGLSNSANSTFHLTEVTVRAA